MTEAYAIRDTREREIAVVDKNRCFSRRWWQQLRGGSGDVQRNVPESSAASFSPTPATVEGVVAAAALPARRGTPSKALSTGGEGGVGGN